MRINDDDGFVVAPRQEVIEAPVKHSVRRLCGGRTWRNCFIQLVTIVTWKNKYNHDNGIITENNNYVVHFYCEINTVIEFVTDVPH